MTLETIKPILEATYGRSPTVDAMAAHLAARIDACDPLVNRERMVMLECWNWFSGGGTAAGVARKIEAALP